MQLPKAKPVFSHLKVPKILFFFMGLVVMYSQEPKPDPLGLMKQGNLNIEGFSYPLFFSNEEHSSFLINYDLSEELDVLLEGFHDTYIVSNRFRTALLGRYYLTEKLYLLSGMELEREAKKDGRTPLAPRIGVISGAGYEVQENFFLEARANIQFNDSKMGSFGEPLIPTPALYSLGGKFKF